LSAYLEASWTVKESIVGSESAFSLLSTPSALLISILCPLADSMGLLLPSNSALLSCINGAVLIYFHHWFVLRIFRIMTAKPRQLVCVFYLNIDAFAYKFLSPYSMKRWRLSSHSLKGPQKVSKPGLPVASTAVAILPYRKKFRLLSEEVLAHQDFNTMKTSAQW